jgi:hypothetical protein
MRDPRIGCAGPQRSVNLPEAEPALRGQDLAGVEIWRPVVDPESRWAGRVRPSARRVLSALESATVNLSGRHAASITLLMAGPRR